MELENLKQIYSLNDGSVALLKKVFGIGDTLTRDQVFSIDEFLTWQSDNNIPNAEAAKAWKKHCELQSSETAQIEAIAITMAEQSLSQLPAIANSQHEKMRAAFVSAYQKKVREMLLAPEFKAQFAQFVETGDLGKLPAVISSPALPGK